MATGVERGGRFLVRRLVDWSFRVHPIKKPAHGGLLHLASPGGLLRAAMRRLPSGAGSQANPLSSGTIGPRFEPQVLIPQRTPNKKARTRRASSFGVPWGIRTPVAAVKGRCPRPLDEGDVKQKQAITAQDHCAAGESGGARRDRTADLYNAIVALSQLSYGPSEQAAHVSESDLNCQL